MRVKEPLMRLLFCLRTQGCVAVTVVCAATAACAGSETAVHAARPEAAVEALIGDAACASDAQCRTVGIGAKACGGPQRYLAWSTRSTDAAALERAADRSARAAETAAAAAGILSTCRIITDPGAHCVSQTSANVAASASTGQPLGRCELLAGSGKAGRAD